MPYQKTILCLANSRRPHGHCFAGKCVTSKGKLEEWLRPVNPMNNNAIADADRRYADGTLAELLDIVTIPLLASKSHDHHTEDHAIVADQRWTKEGRANWDDVVAATDIVKGVLWSNGDHSYHGRNDKVAAEIAVQQAGSLFLIEPSELVLVVRSETQYAGPNRTRVRAEFAFNDDHYNFVVTDPVVEDDFIKRGIGRYNIPESRICVSLPEVFGTHATKLAAAIITPEQAG